MTDNERLLVANRVRVDLALSILRGAIPGHGIDPGDLRGLTDRMFNMLGKLDEQIQAALERQP